MIAIIGSRTCVFVLVACAAEPLAAVVPLQRAEERDRFAAETAASPEPTAYRHRCLRLRCTAAPSAPASAGQMRHQADHPLHRHQLRRGGASRAPSAPSSISNRLFAAGPHAGRHRRPLRRETRRAGFRGTRRTCRLRSSAARSISAFVRGFASSAPNFCISSGKLTRLQIGDFVAVDVMLECRSDGDVRERLADASTVGRRPEVVLVLRESLRRS